jgi:hypothetical protein
VIIAMIVPALLPESCIETSHDGFPSLAWRCCGDAVNGT